MQDITVYRPPTVPAISLRTITDRDLRKLRKQRAAIHIRAMQLARKAVVWEMARRNRKLGEVSARELRAWAELYYEENRNELWALAHDILAP
jgi:hypothetical protein